MGITLRHFYEPYCMARLGLPRLGGGAVALFLRNALAVAQTRAAWCVVWLRKSPARWMEPVSAEHTRCSDFGEDDGTGMDRTRRRGDAEGKGVPPMVGRGGRGRRMMALSQP